MYCTISGQVASKPVISKKSGHIFERSALLSLLSSNGGKCPATGVPLSENDLVSVHVSAVKTKETKQDEGKKDEDVGISEQLDRAARQWRAMESELRHAKKELHNTRQELATCLYRYDAAIRVIRRLEGGAVAGKEDERSVKENEVGDGKLSDQVVGRIRVRSEELQRMRKSRTQTTRGERVSSVQETKDIRVEGGGIRSVARDGADDVVIGCQDGGIRRVNMGREEVTKEVIKRHKGAVVALCGGGEGVISGDDGGCVGIGKGILQIGLGCVRNVGWDVLGNVWTGCENGFAWVDAEREKVVACEREGGGTCCDLHPDGMLLGIGGQSGIDMWDVASFKRVAQLRGNDVRKVVMSDKGYYMLSLSDRGAHVWDLRKSEIVGDVTAEAAVANGLAVNDVGDLACVTFDNHLCQVFAAKKRAQRVASCRTAHVADVKDVGIVWGIDSKWFATAALCHTNDDAVVTKFACQ